MRNKARQELPGRERVGIGGRDRMTKRKRMHWNLRLDPGGEKGFRIEGVQSWK